jgi:hypothetical protein
MKLEMGESLTFSWLKHEKHCQIVQMNWKASMEWSTFVSDKELDKLYQNAKKTFKQEDIIFVSSKVKDSEQLIKQGEIDVIGIELDIANAGQVKNIHAIDVAFHEAGLNYGGEEETASRIIKKYIRTALSIYKYFGVKEADIYFITPFTRDRYRNEYEEAKKSIKQFFDEQGFNFVFHFYSNEDFYSSIFHPVERISKVEKDTSELFSRALILTRLMDNEMKVKNNLLEATVQESPYLEERRIGQIIREAFDLFAEKQLLPENTIEHLQQSDFSKKTFGIAFPVLIDNEDKRFDEKGYARYYATPYKLNGKEYYLCNQWFEKQKEDFIKWYNIIINNDK